MNTINFNSIVKEAWQNYDESRSIVSISDVSAMVSTNHVYRVKFADNNFVIAKLSYFGKYGHFVEDHSIINSLSNNLPAPFDNFLARSLVKKRELFIYHYKRELLDVWVIFYRPIKIKSKLPKRLDESHIVNLAQQFALFHKACTKVRHTLPASSKSTKSDIESLLNYLNTDEGHYEYGIVQEDLERQCNSYLRFYNISQSVAIPIIPVFVDWNIGNFSVTKSGKLFSRWDYDWFRMSTRMMDFYFLSRVVSNVGDCTVFTYNIETLNEDRFILFLKNYHKIYPLTKFEIQMLPEMYRFFLLNYVIKYGRFFFHEVYATKLQTEAFKIQLPSIENFNVSKLLNSLNLG
ncbi:MAG: hypothetical protein V3V14_14615 [Saprospiraceae bacterium]